jgi:hypothetical protein
MATEQKVASKAIPPKSSNTAVTKPIVKRTRATKRSVTSRVTTAAKTPVKSTITTATKILADAQKITSEKKMKVDEKSKLSKVKMERDSFTMPKDEYAQLGELKARLLALGQSAKKSELLRAGIKQLVAMTDLRLKRAMAMVPVIKTGRPKKKK